MFEPEEQQMEICLLKSNLDAIEKELVAQYSALPSLNAEHKKTCRGTISVLNNVRNLTDEVEQIKLENAKLTAQRVQLKQKTDDISENLKMACQDRDKQTEALQQEEQEIETLIRKYEDSLQKKTERFRQTHRFYDEEKINTDTDEENSVIAELRGGMSKKQSVVDELRVQMDATHPEVSEKFLEQLGKLEVKEKLKLVTQKYEDFEERRKALMKND